MILYRYTGTCKLKKCKPVLTVFRSVLKYIYQYTSKRLKKIKNTQVYQAGTWTSTKSKHHCKPWLCNKSYRKTPTRTPMSVSLQTAASPQRLSQSMQTTNPGSQRTSTTSSLQKMMLLRTVIKISTKHLNMKLRRLSEEQNHSTEIILKNSSQHPTAML